MNRSCRPGDGIGATGTSDLKDCEAVTGGALDMAGVTCRRSKGRLASVSDCCFSAVLNVKKPTQTLGELQDAASVGSSVPSVGCSLLRQPDGWHP